MILQTHLGHFMCDKFSGLNWQEFFSEMEKHLGYGCASQRTPGNDSTAIKWKCSRKTSGKDLHFQGNMALFASQKRQTNSFRALQRTKLCSWIHHMRKHTLCSFCKGHSVACTWKFRCVCVVSNRTLKHMEVVPKTFPGFWVKGSDMSCLLFAFGWSWKSKKQFYLQPFPRFLLQWCLNDHSSEWQKNLRVFKKEGQQGMFSVSRLSGFAILLFFILGNLRQTW